MDLQGKKILFLGDSITEGVGASAPDKVYWRVLGQNTGAQVTGYGISGSRYADQLSPTAAREDRYFASRVEEMDAAADIVVVYGGVNDFAHGTAPIGTPADRTPATFTGAVHTLFRALIEKYPEAVIVICTPTHWTAEENTVSHRGYRTAAPLSVYAEIIRQTAAQYSLPVCDLYAVSGMQARVEEQKRFLPDGVHPSDVGHARVAARLGAFLKKL